MHILYLYLIFICHISFYCIYIYIYTLYESTPGYIPIHRVTRFEYGNKAVLLSIGHTKTYQNGVMKTMFRLRQDKEDTDLMLQSGSVQIQCHRIVLVVASDYFKTMFRCGLSDSTSDIVQPMIT